MTGASSQLVLSSRNYLPNIITDTIIVVIIASIANIPAISITISTTTIIGIVTTATLRTITMTIVASSPLFGNQKRNDSLSSLGSYCSYG